MSKIQNQKVSMAEKVGYGLGDCSANLVFQMMMIYQTKFYTDVFGLEGAIAGTVMLVARIVDAFVDPTVGILSDRTQTKWGKYRPWVLWTALPFMVFYVLAFYNPGIEEKGLVALYATISYTLLMTMYWGESCRQILKNVPVLPLCVSSFLRLHSLWYKGLPYRWSASFRKVVTRHMAGSVPYPCLLPLVSCFW